MKHTWKQIQHCRQPSRNKTDRGRYSNITKDQVIAYIGVCPVCTKEQPVKKKLKGASHPIQSLSFRDRFQADLVDMQSNPQKNWHGVLMKWIIALKDHFTKIVYLIPSPSKEAHIVAAELNHICGFMGYPLVYHTDNGGEVSGKDVVEVMRALNPTVLTVTGRPRTPSDQGSVERSNRTSKAILSCLEEVQRQQGKKDPNWVMLLGQVMSALNSGRNSNKNSQSPYYHVFGMEMHEMADRSIKQLRKAKTVSEMDALMSNANYHKKMVALGEIGSPSLFGPKLALKKGGRLCDG